MNTLTAPQRPDRRELDAADTLHTLSTRTQRTALPDRVALRLALTLLLWSTRPRRSGLTTDQRRSALARHRRELQWRTDYHRLPLL